MICLDYLRWLLPEVSCILILKAHRCNLLLLIYLFFFLPTAPHYKVIRTLLWVRMFPCQPVWCPPTVDYCIFTSWIFRTFTDFLLWEKNPKTKHGATSLLSARLLETSQPVSFVSSAINQPSYEFVGFTSPRPSPQLLLGLWSTQIRRQDLREFCHSTGFSSFYSPVTLCK